MIAKSLLRVLAVTVLLLTGWAAPARAAIGPVHPASAWTAALEEVIHGDVAQSVTLPSGEVLWVFGDTTRVNGVPTVGPYGYPHSAFVKQTAGTLTFGAVPGPHGYGWQQVPNWSDGTYFWMSTPIVDNGSLYILGERIRGVSPFTVVGSYVAVFDASTLAFQRIVPVAGGATGATMWGGVARTSSGWWLTGTHPVKCTYTNCSAADMAFVPFGRLADPTRWTVYNNVIPETTNIGVVLALRKTTTGWAIFSKQGDAYGGSTRIERLSATSVTGTWTSTGSWEAPSPAGTVTYAVAVHPEQAANSGQILVSYNVNGNDDHYYPRFLYLPV